MAQGMPQTIDLDDVHSGGSLFEQIYLHYQKRIRRYLIRLVGVELADDLTQDVFLRAYVAFPNVRGKLAVQSWLYRIAHNLACDTLLRRHRIGWQSLDVWEEERAAEYPALVQDDPADHAGEVDCVQCALNRLSPGYRQALLLNVYKGYNATQIAEAVGIAPSGGKMYLSRARKRFERYYAEAQEDSSPLSLPLPERQEK